MRVRIIEFLALDRRFLETFLGIAVLHDFDFGLLRTLDVFYGLDDRFFWSDNLADFFEIFRCILGHGLLHANSPLISLAF